MSILSIIASIEVSEAVKLILGKKPSLAGKILHCDIGNMKFEEVELSKSESCPVCGSTPSDLPMPLEQRLVNQVCGRDGKRVFVITPKTNLELNLDNLYPILMNKGFGVKVKTDLGTTFDAGAKGTASILNSGIMIIEGARSQKDAYDLYEQIVMDELRVPSSIVE